jgi:hypothetical protein
MSGISRAALFVKLNSIGYKALEASVVFCKLRGNPYVELSHWLHQLMQAQDTDLHHIIRAFGLDVSQLVSDVQATLDRAPRGANACDLSTSLADSVERAWTYASLKFGETSIRSGHVIFALANDTALKPQLVKISQQFSKINSDQLGEQFLKLTDGSPEAVLAAAGDRGLSGAPGEASGAMAPAQLGKQEALNKYCKDLTENAKSGKMDPIVGRDEEIRQCIDILMRRRQNNPILTGEAGVGKTAVVEGFAQRIVKGDVPPQLKDVRLLELDVGLLQAGASMKGEFENRLRQVIDEVQASPKPIILFIDEVHTLMGAGRSRGHQRRGPTPQARARPRNAPHHRRHHPERVQAALREGPGHDPPVPGRQGRRARRSQVPAHDPRARGRHGEALQDPGSRRGPRSRREAQQALHPGPPAPRQGGEPHRHRVRPRRRQPPRVPGEIDDLQKRIDGLKTRARDR